MGNRIHIALSPWDLTDSYNRHTATTVASILENCSEPVTVHLLYESRLSINKENETKDTKEKYRKLGEKYNAEILFHDIVLPEWVTDVNRNSLQHFTPGSLLRLYLPEVLPNEIEKIIYFDSDMIVLVDLVKLWDIEVDRYSFGAVLEANRSSSLWYYWDKANQYGINMKKYINSGLLVMNLRKLRENGELSSVVMELIKHHPEYPYPDQDALNLLYQEKEMFFLEEKYNLPVGLRMTDFRLKRKLGIIGDQYGDCILHFNGTKKPWKIYSGPVDEYYWNYLRKTPWGNDSVYVNKMYGEVKATRKTLVDKIMSTPLNKYLRLAESVVKKS